MLRLAAYVYMYAFSTESLTLVREQCFIRIIYYYSLCYYVCMGSFSPGVHLCHVDVVHSSITSTLVLT